MRLPRRTATCLSTLLLLGALVGCSDDAEPTPGGPPGQTDRVGEDQAPAVDDGTDEEDVGGSTTGDADQVEPESTP